MSEIEMMEKTAEASATKRKSKKKKDEEIAAAPAKTKEERLNDLITKGKLTHRLSSKEVGELCEELNMDNDEIDKFYERLDANSILVTDIVTLEDLTPDTGDLDNIEEISDEDIANLPTPVIWITSRKFPTKISPIPSRWPIHSPPMTPYACT